MNNCKMCGIPLRDSTATMGMCYTCQNKKRIDELLKQQKNPFTEELICALIIVAVGITFFIGSWRLLG